MQEKRQGATQCAAEVVIKEPVDEQAIKHAFWGYLQAYQQLRFYFGKWVEETLGKNKKQGNVLLDVWKVTFLDQQELNLRIRKLTAHELILYTKIRPDLTFPIIDYDDLFQLTR